MWNKKKKIMEWARTELKNQVTGYDVIKPS